MTALYAAGGFVFGLWLGVPIGLVLGGIMSAGARADEADEKAWADLAEAGGFTTERHPDFGQHGLQLLRPRND